MPSFIADKPFYRRLFLLAMPLVLQNIITFSVNVADNLMVGSLGELALSGAFISNQLQVLLHMLVLGLSAALIVLAAQYWGKRDEASTKAVINIALRFCLASGLVFFLAALFFPSQLLGLFSHEAEVVAAGRQYFDVIRFSYIFFCLTQILLAAMRCVEKVRIAFYLSLMTFVVNVSLNYILIFGHLGFPALGLRGAAIATLTARILESVVILYYVLRVDMVLRFRFADFFRRAQTTLLRRFLRFGLPVVIGDITWGINIAVQGAIIGRLGPTALASVSIANVVFLIVGVAAFGSAGASSVIIGQAVGSGDREKVKQYARALQLVYVGIGLVSGLVLYLIRDPVLSLYNLEPETLRLARQLLVILSVTIIGTAYQMPALTGIVRAGGATHFVLVNDLIFIWGLVMPAAMLAAFVFHASPAVVFALLKSDQILKCAVAVIKVNRFRWIKDLTLEKKTG